MSPLALILAASSTHPGAPVFIGIVVGMIMIFGVLASVNNNKAVRNKQQRRSWEELVNAQGAAQPPRLAQLTPEQVAAVRRKLAGQQPAPQAFRQPPPQRRQAPPQARPQRKVPQPSWQSIAASRAPVPPPVEPQHLAPAREAVQQPPTPTTHLAGGRTAMNANNAISSTEIGGVAARRDAAAAGGFKNVDARALAKWLTPATLRAQFIVTEVLLPPVAFRDNPHL